MGEPSESDLATIFKRLRSLPANKQCFDCGANNPTWASVTYGVFLCIDCSAVHRSLGVHLTFIRSTQLDANWTWLQARAMQVGGNANATAFFRQHGSNTRDAQQKYNSRTAAMYREKLHALASKAMKQYGSQLHINPDGSLSTDAAKSPDTTKDVDFFKDHEDGFRQNSALSSAPASAPVVIANGATNGSRLVQKEEVDDGKAPSVEAALSMSPTEAQKIQEPRKSTIGGRKPPAKKGAKKGLGAQRVKTNFSQIENEARERDKQRDELEKNTLLQETRTKEDEQKKMVSLKLAYKDLSMNDQRRENKAKDLDPRKAAQFERLGMAYSGTSRGVSHSVISDMQTIEQETPNDSSSRGGMGGGGRSNSRYDDDDSGFHRSSSNRGAIEDEFEMLGAPPKYKKDNLYGLKDSDRYSSAYSGRSSKKSNWVDESDRSADRDVIEEIPAHKPSSDDRGRSRKTYDAPSTDDTAQKKYGNAKAISSDMFFNKNEPDFESRQTMSKFEGQSSISSADFFSGGPGSSASRGGGGNSSRYDSSTGYELAEIKDSVKQGVHKVAGRLSNIASNVMSSVQDHYG